MCCEAPLRLCVELGLNVASYFHCEPCHTSFYLLSSALVQLKSCGLLCTFFEAGDKISLLVIAGDVAYFGFLVGAS